MEEFLKRFHQVSDSAPGAGFYKGLMTAMITLGAFIGMAPSPVSACRSWLFFTISNSL